MTPAHPKRILIFNVNWVGDVLFSTAAIRTIRRNFPESFIACAIPARCYAVLKGSPHIDEVIMFDESGWHKGLLGQLAFVRLLKSKKFDTVFLFHRSFTRALMCRLADIPERIGYYTKKRGFLLAKKIMPPKKDSCHRIDYYLNLLEKAGLRVEDRYLEFFVGQEDERSVAEVLERHSIAKDDFLAVLNPGGNWVLKRWPREYWAELGDRLVQELGAKIVITGSQADSSLAQGIRASMREEALVAAGLFNIKQLGALCKRADLFVTADTGPLHIAVSVGARKVVALFGPTSPAVTGPYPAKNTIILQKDTGCVIPCYELRCKDNRCMKAITPDDVLAALKGHKG